MTASLQCRRILVGAAFALAALLPVGPAGAANQLVRVGISSGETEDVWAVVKAEAAKRGLDVKVVPFAASSKPSRPWAAASSP